MIINAMHGAGCVLAGRHNNLHPGHPSLWIRDELQIVWDIAEQQPCFDMVGSKQDVLRRFTKQLSFNFGQAICAMKARSTLQP